MKRRFILPGILLLYALLTALLTAKDGGDFDVYLDAAQKLKAGANIYAPPFVKGLQYYYSVFFALLLIPFSSQVFWTEVAWSLLSYYFLYRTFVLISRDLDFNGMTTRQYRWWAVLTAVLALQFILYNVAMIQVTIFMLWAIFESIHLLDKRKEFGAGALLGLAINVKTLPIIMLGYLFYRGYWKALGAVLLTLIALYFVPALFIGADLNRFLHLEWWGVINPGNKEHLLETGIGLHSLVAFLPVYLTETQGEMDFRRHIWNLPLHQVEIILQLARLFFLGLSLYFLKSRPFQRENDPMKRLWEVSYFTLLIPLLLPHQQKYAFLLALPLVSWILYFFIKTYPSGWTRGVCIAFGVFLFSALFFSPLYGSSIIGQFLFRFTQHYRLLTVATLLLIPVALYCSPQRLRTSVFRPEPFS